jgi:hypothetical protein
MNSFRKGLLVGMLLSVGLTLFGAFLGGCAHTCLAPEERAAKFGTVLECKDVPGEPKTRCLISTPDGDVSHFFKACE